MKKWLFFFSLFTFTILGSFLAYLYTYRAEFISQELSKVLKCQVTIKTLNLSSSGIYLKDVNIFLKKDSTLLPFFSAKNITLTTTPLEMIKSLFDITPAHISKICIEQPIFYVMYHELQEMKLQELSLKNRRTSRSFFVDQLELIDPAFEWAPLGQKLRLPIIITFTKEPLCLQDIFQDIFQEVLKIRGVQNDANKTAATS